MKRMSMPSWDRIKAVFAEACELPAEQVPAFLDRVCEGDAEMRREMEALLAARSGKQVATGGAARELAAASTMRSAIITEGAGTIIGPYKLLQLIGEGGFGSVFLAEQTQPVRRRVAVKIIKLGMDTKQVIARFEAERQALALMDHPHIAKVLDGGATPLTERGGGRPYFVMEYVVGDAITAFADAHKLTIRDRLDLFQQVCSAVQHAHTKGIIHRDLKPGNVLVTTMDGKPFAKVIDFGIAKATTGPGGLTDKTLFTEHRQLIGTPEYMSPEQAVGSPDIDTRTDVYALGVLLYELLTGQTPFDGARLRSAAYAEIQRIIKDEEPPSPSQRLSRSLDTIAATAAARQMEPEKLRASVHGELDWIVMRALDKERGRRYESANSLADDVRRHLAGEAVVAAPVSKVYRLQKFVQKNRGSVVAVSAVMLALVAGGSVAAWQWQRAESQASHARRVLGALGQFARTQKTQPYDLSEAELNVIEAPIRGLGIAPGDLNIHGSEDGRTSSFTIGGASARVVEADMAVSLMGALAESAMRASEVMLNKTSRASVEIARQRDEIASRTDAAEWSAYTANLALAQAAIEAGNYPEARSRTADVPDSKRGWEWTLLRLTSSAVDMSVPNHFRAMVFNEGGSRISPVLPVVDYSSETGEQLMPEDHERRQMYLAELSVSGEVRVFPATPSHWRWEQIPSVRFLVERLTGERLTLIDFVSFDPSGTKLVWRSGGVGYPNTPIHRVVSVDQWGGPERPLDQPVAVVQEHSISWRPAADHLKILRATAILASSPNGPSGLTITTPDGTRRIVGGADKTVRFYEANDGKPTLPATAESPEGVYREVAIFRMPDAVTNLQMTGDGTRLIIHLQDGSARVWDIRDPEERRKDLQAEWAERVPAGAYLDTLWASDTPDDKLHDAVMNDASLTPLRRLVAAEMLEERLEDDRMAAEQAFAAVTKDQTDKTAVQAAAAARTDLSKRMHAQLIAMAAGWEYTQAEPSDAEKLAEETKQRRLAEAELVFTRLTQPSEAPDYRWPTESELTHALSAFVDVLGEESPQAIRSRFYLGKMLLPTDPDRAIVQLERAAELADKTDGFPIAETIDIWAQTATQLALQLEFDRARRWYAKLSAVLPEAQERRELPRFLEVLMDGMQVQWTVRDIAPFEKVLAAFQRLQGEGIRREVFEVLSRASWSSAQLRFRTDAEGQLIWTNSVRYAERALRLNPDHHRALQALALARWRLGQVSVGLEAIADRVNRVGDSARLGTIDWSLVALIRHQLSLADAVTLAAAGEIDMKADATIKAPLTADEHRQRAREALARAKALMQPAADGTPSPWANDEDAKALIAEAESLIGGAP